MKSDIFPGYNFQYLTYIKTTRICYPYIPNLSWYKTFLQLSTKITLNFRIAKGKTKFLELGGNRNYLCTDLFQHLNFFCRGFKKSQHSCQYELFVRGDSIETYVKIFLLIFQSVKNLWGKKVCLV